MTEYLHLTDEEALDSLLCCIKHQGEEEVSNLIIAVVGSHFQSLWLAGHVQEVLTEVIYNHKSLTLHYKSTCVKFVRYDESLNTLSAIQPVAWLPLCDNIPAKLISWMNYRTRVGEAKYWDQKRKGGQGE